MNPGFVIRQRRKELGLAQWELAEGICTQGQISHIESGNTIPTADILYALAKRLKLPLEDCFHIWDKEREHADWLKQEMEKCVRYRKYEELLRLVREAKKNKYFKYGDGLAFILWNDALIMYFLRKNAEKAVLLLDEAINALPSIYTIRYIQIENSRGIFYADRGLWNKANEIYENVLKFWNKIDNKSEDHTLDVRIRHNISKIHYFAGNNNKALFHCEQAIERCVEEDTLCLYADLHYLKGQILYKLDRKEESFQMFNHAKIMFETSGQTAFLSITLEKMKELFIDKYPIDIT